MPIPKRIKEEILVKEVLDKAEDIQKRVLLHDEARKQGKDPYTYIDNNNKEKTMGHKKEKYPVEVSSVCILKVGDWKLQVSEDQDDKVIIETPENGEETYDIEEFKAVATAFLEHFG